ncbi:hypothetical protein F5887DRAFT_919101 [Amanita rubescens]|nr:hypothetical protein F5887DRAFT_919101 [Amanita rubescens]
MAGEEHLSPSLAHRVPTSAPFMRMAPRGRSIASRTLSIDQFFYERRLVDIFEGPLSDAEDFGSGDDVGLVPAPSIQANTGAECPSIQSLRERQFRDLFEEPLSDVEGPSSGRGEDIVSAQGSGQKARLASANRKRRRRHAQQEAEGTDDKHVAKKRRLETAQDVIYVDHSLPSVINVTKAGWIGKRVADLPQRVFTVSELEGDYGMTCFPWDGRRGSTTHLLLDGQGRIVGVLLGWPRDTEGWTQVHDEVLKLLDKAADAHPDCLKKTHKRGDFPSLAHGLSFGGGQRSGPSRALNTSQFWLQMA